MRKIGIIGLGQVGSALAAQLLAANQVDQLSLFDQSTNRAVGLQNDLLAAWPTADLVINDWSELNSLDVLVVALGNQEQLLQSRFGELTFNAQAVDHLKPHFQDNHFSGVLINLANPNEALTALIQEGWGLQPKQVLGLGTVIDTARLRLAIYQTTKQNYHSITGYVYGQHDGALVTGWSTVRINGQTVDKPVFGKKIDSHELDIQAKLNSYYALKGLGSDWNALVAWTQRIIRAVLMNTNETFSVAVQQPQFGGFVSFPVQINRHGVGNFILLPLYPLEEEQIKVAANAIQQQVATMHSVID